jgi:hypothetical protein
MTLKKWVLKHLAIAHPHPLTPAILHGGAAGSIYPTPTLTEVKTTLEDLEAKSHVLSQRDDIDDVVRYGLTDTGLMEARR